MKKIFTTTFTLLCCSFFAAQLLAQTIWTGPTMTFSKAGGADWMLEENQDRLTDTIWITRANNKGIFNIAVNEEYIGNGDDNYGPSPIGTEWAFGTTADGVENLTFSTWIVATTVNDPYAEANPTTLVDRDMVLHLIDDDIYIDIKFLSWGVGGAGQGAFSYERSTNDVVNVSELDADRDLRISVFPNPATDYLTIQHLKQPQPVVIFNANGQIVQRANARSEQPIKITQLPKGMYFLRTLDGQHATFVKK
ncbi:MAG: T9SS type A sorting domain-containing protein [Saprospiraceae bacterium]|nr:T9SS type A sorting domain-containing protein [Saprospiraceae bacterium]